MPGRPWRNSCSAAFDAANDFRGIGIRELLDDEQQARTVVDDGVADERRMLLDHLGDVAQAQRLSAASATATLASSAGEVMGWTCWIPSR